MENNWHQSMRGFFAGTLHDQMKKNKDIWLLTGDLGYKMFDPHFKDFPDRAINCGASEQAMVGIACGLAMEGKIPFVYSITPFLLYRPFETIRNYVNELSLPVKLIGGGRGRDYRDDGYSHWALEDKNILRVLKNIKACYPETKEEIPDLIDIAVKTNLPFYINLRR